jgi:hypothetical protein
MTDGQEWRTVREYAEHRGVTPRTVVRWVHTDPNMRTWISSTGRVIRIHCSEFDRTTLPAAS